MKKQINIFIVSPTDVNPERNIAKEACHLFDDAVGDDIEINPVLWEYHPMSYHKNAQANIDSVLEKCDIFIVILWHRLGSIVDGYEGAITKSKNVTGTQYEIEKILASKKELVYFYFKTKEKNFVSHELEEALKQKQLLDTFLKDINLTKGSTKHGYQEFESGDEFREKIASHLKSAIWTLSGKRVSMPKKPKEKKPISKSQRYFYMFLYIIVATVAFVFFLWFWFMPPDMETIVKSSDENNVVLAKSNRDTVSNNTTMDLKKVIIPNQEADIVPDIAKRITIKIDSKILAGKITTEADTLRETIPKEVKVSLAPLVPKIIKEKKYFSFNGRKMKEISQNPYYLHYKNKYSNGSNFTMTQLRNVSVISVSTKKQLNVEKDRYKRYLEKQLKTARDHLAKLERLHSSSLANLFYSYANGEDMFDDLTDTQMRERLVAYIDLHMEELESSLNQLDELEIYER